MSDVKKLIEETRLGRPMNAGDAARLAEKCWGEHGCAEERHGADRRTRYRVGTKGAPEGSRGYGVGASWEEAFADAARRCRVQLRLVA
jgi:hypothetical protein